MKKILPFSLFLHEAINNDNKEIVQYLIDYGVN